MEGLGAEEVILCPRPALPVLCSSPRSLPGGFEMDFWAT